MKSEKVNEEINELQTQKSTLENEIEVLSVDYETAQKSFSERFSDKALEAASKIQARLQALRDAAKNLALQIEGKRRELAAALKHEEEEKAAARLVEIKKEREAMGESFALKYNEVCAKLQTEIEALDALSVRYYELNSEAAKLGAATGRGDVVENWLKNRTHTLSPGLAISINIYRHEKERAERKAKGA